MYEPAEEVMATKATSCINPGVPVEPTGKLVLHHPVRGHFWAGGKMRGAEWDQEKAEGECSGWPEHGPRVDYPSLWPWPTWPQFGPLEEGQTCTCKCAGADLSSPFGLPMAHHGARGRSFLCPALSCCRSAPAQVRIALLVLSCTW